MHVPCGLKGCRNHAVWAAVKLFGDRKALLCCDRCKPDRAKRPESQRHLPFFYDVRPLVPVAVDRQGNTVVVNEDFDPSLDASGRFPVKKGHWRYAHAECP